MTESNDFSNYAQPAPPQEPLQRGRQFASGQMLLGKYEVMSLIGVGGMGKVYKVRQVFLNKALALKVLDMQQAMSELQLRRFQLEAQAAFSLSHQNLVKVFDFGLLEAEEPYLVMDYVDGVTLHDHLKKKGPLTPEQAVKVFIQAASGLAYAHQRSVIHRDIKPSNIMLDVASKIGANNTVKIVDFGIAKVAESGEVQGLTRTGEVFGSPLYMSPEQCSGEIVDHRSDIYSLGCSLFEALTGTPPHVGNSALRTMMLHQTATAPYLHEASLGTTYPENLETIVHRMLEKSPNARYQSLDDVVEDLSKALGQTSIATTKSTVVSPAPASVETTAGLIAMKPLNFALMIVSVMALTSAATLGIERLVLRRFYVTSEPPKVKVVTAQDKAMKDEAAKGLMMADLPEIDNGKDEDVAKVFEDAKPITPRIFEENGQKVEELIFPEITIGEIRNYSFCQIFVDSMEVWAKPAREVVQFPVPQMLQFRIGGMGFYQGLRFPSIFSKIDKGLFQELHIESSSMAGNLGRKFDQEHQSIAANKVLEIASSWKTLNGVSVQGLDVTRDSVKALSNLKNLQYLQLLECNIDVSALTKAAFLRRLKFLSVTSTDCAKIIDAICSSPNLESLSLADTQLTADSLEQLKNAPKLTFLDLQITDISKEGLEAITKLTKLDKLSIRQSDLKPSQLNYLLKNCPALRFMELNGPAMKYVREGLVNDPRVKALPEPTAPISGR